MRAFRLVLWDCVIVAFAVTFARFDDVFRWVLGCWWFSFGFGVVWVLDVAAFWMTIDGVYDDGCGVTPCWVLELWGLAFDVGCLLLYFAMCFVSVVRCCASSLLVCCFA